MTYTMRRPTPDERDKITRCRRQFFEVERLGLLKEQVETLLPARLNDGMPRGSPHALRDRRQDDSGRADAARV